MGGGGGGGACPTPVAILESALYGSGGMLKGGGRPRKRLSAGSVARGRAIAALPAATACLGARFYSVSQGKPGEAKDQLIALCCRRCGGNLHVPKGRGQFLPDDLSQRLRGSVLWSRSRGVTDGDWGVAAGRHV